MVVGERLRRSADGRHAVGRGGDACLDRPAGHRHAQDRLDLREAGDADGKRQRAGGGLMRKRTVRGVLARLPAFTTTRKRR